MTAARPGRRRRAEGRSTPGALERLVRYAAVGSAGAASFFVVLLLLVEVAGAGVMLSTSVAFVLVVLQNYVLHRGWTFESEAPHGRALPQFFAMSGAGFAINWCVMYVGAEVLALDYRVVQAVAIAIVVTWNFLVSRLLIFAPAPALPPGSER